MKIRMSEIVPSRGSGSDRALAFRSVALAATLLAVGGCSMFSDDGKKSAAAAPAASANELAAAPKPIYEPGDTFVFSDDGVVVQEQVVSVTPDRVTWTNDQGLIWATTNEIVTPPLTWSSHPELGRGRQTIIGDPGNLFPLQEGNVVAFSVRGNSETVTSGWQDENRCAVTGQAEVQVSAGNFTTYRIDCQRKDFSESIFYSPVVQNYVLRERVFANGSERKELVSVSLASDRSGGAPTSLTSQAAPRAAVQSDSMHSSSGHSGDSMAKPSDSMAMSPDQRMAMLVNRLERVVDKLEQVPSGAGPAGGDAMARAAMSMKDGGGHGSGGAGGHGGGSGKYGAHLASYRSTSAAQKGWSALKGRFPELGDKAMLTTEYDPGDGRGTFVRLVAGRFESKEDADGFCRALKAKRQFCQGMRVAP